MNDDERDDFNEALEGLTRLCDDLDRNQRRREVERKHARFYSDGKLRKRPWPRNWLIRDEALVREPLGPHAELWITYAPCRREALAIRADVKLAAQLPQTISMMDPDALNGYVAFEKRYAPRLPAGDQNLVQYIPVHGGITYAEKDSFAAVWGFNTMHSNSEQEPRTNRDWIRAHCWILYRGLLLAEQHWKEFSRAGRERKMEIAQEILDLVPEQSVHEKLGFTALLNTLMGKIG